MRHLIKGSQKGKGLRSGGVQIARANSADQNEIFRIQPRFTGPLVGAGKFGVVEGVVARTLPVLLGWPFPDRLDAVDAA